MSDFIEISAEKIMSTHLNFHGTVFLSVGAITSFCISYSGDHDIIDVHFLPDKHLTFWFPAGEFLSIVKHYGTAQS